MLLTASTRSIRGRLAIHASATALLFTAGSAWAADAPGGKSDNQLTEIAPVIVTAQRRAQDSQTVPVSVQAISAKDIQSLGIKETEDIAQITPNVSIVNNQGAGNQPMITIRGIGLNDFDTNNAGPNGVYVDDVYISAPSAQSFGIFDLDQVQILKGPQGTLYGRNTSGGAVLFTSKRPTDSFTSDLHLEYGNYNTLSLTGGVGGPITDKLDFRVAALVNRSDGYMHNLLTHDPASGTNNEAVRIQLLYKPTDELKVLFSASAGYDHALPAEYQHIGVFVPGTEGSPSPTLCSPAQAFAGGCVDQFGYGTQKGFYDGEWSRDEELRLLNLLDSLRIDYNWGPITLTSISAYEHSDKKFPEDSDAGPNNLLRVDYGARSDTYTQELRAAQNTKDFNWVVGAYYLHEWLRQNQPLYLFTNGDKFGGFGVPPGPGNFDGIAQRSFDVSEQIIDTVAVYGQGDYNIGALTLTLGGRYTYENKSFDYDGSTQYQLGGTGDYGPIQNVIRRKQTQSVSNFTWRAAAAYHLTSQVMAYASVATGFKSGDFNGSFLSNNEEQAALQLKPVLPEKVTAYEIGAKASFFERRVVLDVAAFYNDYRDEQIFAQVPQLLQTSFGPIEGVTQILTNADRAHTEGVEVNFTAVPLRGLTLNLQPAWLRTRLDKAGLPGFAGQISLDGLQLANSPRFSFVGSADYRLPVGDDDGIDFRWTSSFKSHQFFDSTNDPYIQQGPYWVHNLNITYQSHQGWEAGIYVRNVTGTKYDLTSSDLSSPFGLLEPIIGMPRTYGVSLNYHY